MARKKAAFWLIILLMIIYMMDASSVAESVPLSSCGDDYTILKEAGNVVTFGTYPQTKEGKDKTPIEWIVLDYDAASNRVLLLSRCGLDTKPYNTSVTSVTWETCTLRRWLNSEFLNKAFSETEQSAILISSVDNSFNQGYEKWSTDGENSTQDQIFLLSYSEANRYLGIKIDGAYTKARVVLTAYAIACGALEMWTSEEYQTGRWWLRSRGGTLSRAAYVDDTARGLLRDCLVNEVDCTVRPALWLNLNQISSD